MTSPGRPSFRYRHSGLRFASALALPEWDGFADHDGGGEADVSIMLGEPRQCDAPPDYAPAYSGAALSFSVPDIGCWTIRGGIEVSIIPAPGAQERELRLFTLGSAWGAIGYQRGLAMFHGSAVAVPGGAALFCGGPEHGKSTMAAAMQARGHALLADDLSRVDPPAEAGSAAMLHPSAGQVKLWDTAIAHFGLQGREMRRDYYRDNKFHLPLADDVPDTDPVPLVAVHVLEWGEEIVIERLRGAQAMTALVQGTMYRKPFLEAMDLLGQQLMFGAQIAGSLAVYRVTRPRDFTQLDELCERLEQAWRDLAG